VGVTPIDHDVLPALVFEADADGAVHFISAEWTRVTGQSLADALGEGWTRFIHPDDATSLRAALRQAEGDVSVDFRVLGRERVLGFTAMLRPRIVAGRRLGVVSVSVPAGDAISALERLEAHTGALLAAIPDLFFHVDAEGRFLGYHAPVGAQLAQQPEAFVGRRMDEVMPPEITTTSMAAATMAAQTKHPVAFEYRLEVDGQHRDFEARAVPMPNSDTLFVVRDVTETKRAQAELVAAREAALESSRHKTQFLANVSHEIRTPLNGILGVTQLLRTWALPNEAGEYLDVLQTAGESLLAMVDDVLDLSKIEANRLELEVHTFDPDRVVENAVRAFAPQAKKKGIGLTVETSIKGAVRGDAARLRQIVNNLVANAVKFTEVGDVRVRLVREASGLCLLSVRDTGPGIADDQHHRVFEPFVQVEGTQRRYGGTGLGLSITRRLARLMGGDVSVASAPGMGSTFTVSLSLPEVQFEESPAVPTWRATPPPRALKVLLVEDNDVNAQLTQALLIKLGHQVVVVTNGQAALDAVKADGRLDLVLMDVQMPGLDGLATTRLIRSHERGTTSHLPIVALTANAMKGDDVLCLSAGMDAYLAKPVTVEALKDLLSWFGSAQPASQ
jgi:PAS domain S-box-containing protein